jgi:hypothetical protein
MDFKNAATNLENLVFSFVFAIQFFFEHLLKFSYFQELTTDIIFRIALGQNESMIFKNPYVKVIKRWFERDLVHPKQILALIIPSERVVWFLKRVFRSYLRSPVAELVKKVHQEIIFRRKKRVFFLMSFIILGTKKGQIWDFHILQVLHFL